MTQRTDSILIENATDDRDVERINEFFNSKPIKQDLHRFTYQPTLERAFRRDDRRLFYISDDNEVIAALMIWCESQVLDPEEAQIRLIAVAPSHRNSGLGQAICRRAEEFASEYGQQKITADVACESDSVEFWKSEGYAIEYEWETDNNRKMCRMWKSLS